MADYSKYFPSGEAQADYSAYFPKAAPVMQANAPAQQLQPELGPVFSGMVGAVRGASLPLELGQMSGQLLDRGAYKAGGAVTDVGAAVGLPPEVSAGLGFGTNVATQALPMLLSGGIAKAAGSPLFESASRSLMGRALKPPVSAVESGDAAKAIDTMLKGGFNVTPGGVQKMQQEISRLDDQVKTAIANSPGMVNQGYPLSEIYKTLQKFRQQVNPQADKDAILQAWNEFKSVFPGSLPVQQAQALKQGTYSALAGKYGEQGSASVEAQKALARGLRTGIGDEVPQVVAPLAREAELINAFELAARRVGVAGNRDPSGLAYLASNPVAGAGMIAERSQLVKSLLARGLYSGREYIPGTLGYAGYVPFGMYSGQAPK